MAYRSAPYGTRYSGWYKNDVGGTMDFYLNGTKINSVSATAFSIGAYALPLTDGQNGQVLKTNGTGTVAWDDDDTGD